MKKTQIVIPVTLKNNLETYEFLGMLNEKLSRYQNTNIALDFSGTNWIDANICSPLGGILESAKNSGNSIFIRSAHGSVKKFFINNSFVKLYQKNNSNYINSNIKYKGIKATDDKAYEKYLKSEVNGVMISNGMENSVASLNKAITEVFINVNMHTDSTHAYFAGTYYNKTKVFVISISNIGLTIHETLIKNGIHFENDCDAILWTTKKNTSTSTEVRTKGLGLYELTEFAKGVGGIIHIISGYGMVTIGSRGILRKRVLETKFPGTTFFVKCDTKKIPKEESIKDNSILTLQDILNWE